MTILKTNSIKVIAVAAAAGIGTTTAGVVVSMTIIKTYLANERTGLALWTRTILALLRTQLQYLNLQLNTVVGPDDPDNNNDDDDEQQDRHHQLPQITVLLFITSLY